MTVLIGIETIIDTDLVIVLFQIFFCKANINIWKAVFGAQDVFHNAGNILR